LAPTWAERGLRAARIATLNPFILYWEKATGGSLAAANNWPSLEEWLAVLKGRSYGSGNSVKRLALPATGILMTVSSSTFSQHQPSDSGSYWVKSKATSAPSEI
jgi:hypothetical protein